MSKGEVFMFINKTVEGLNNVCGKNIAELRKNMKMSQRIECGKRFVTDIEIIAFAKIFQVSYEQLLQN